MNLYEIHIYFIILRGVFAVKTSNWFLTLTKTYFKGQISWTRLQSHNHTAKTLVSIIDAVQILYFNKNTLPKCCTVPPN